MKKICLFGVLLSSLSASEMIENFFYLDGKIHRYPMPAPYERGFFVERYNPEWLEGVTIETLAVLRYLAEDYPYMTNDEALKALLIRLYDLLPKDKI